MLIHLYNQGNNQRRIFFKRENYLFFLKKVEKHLSPCCDILAWCLMPNHFHFLIYIDDSFEINSNFNAIKGSNDTSEAKYSIDGNQLNKVKGISSARKIFSHNLRIMLSSYTQAINRQQGTSGSLFRQNSKIKELSNSGKTNRPISSGWSGKSDYAFNCFQYIHQNPIKASLVLKMEDWEFSSFRDYLDTGKGRLINKDLAQEIINYDTHDFYAQSYIVADETWILEKDIAEKNSAVFL